jgi:hypothetical protein
MIRLLNRSRHDAGVDRPIQLHSLVEAFGLKIAEHADHAMIVHRLPHVMAHGASPLLAAVGCGERPSVVAEQVHSPVDTLRFVVG